MLGGLAFFLYGMHMLSASLEKMSGGKLTKILEKLTGNVWISVALGAAITALVQSSSATTVITVGLVNSGIFWPERIKWGLKFFNKLFAAFIS
jgi:phosphate:Na+ symporter